MNYATNINLTASLFGYLKMVLVCIRKAFVALII